MALSLNSNKIVTDGLVLYCDENNLQKSYAGIPITNLWSASASASANTNIWSMPTSGTATVGYELLPYTWNGNAIFRVTVSSGTIAGFTSFRHCVPAGFDATYGTTRRLTAKIKMITGSITSLSTHSGGGNQGHSAGQWTLLPQSQVAASDIGDKSGWYQFDADVSGSYPSGHCVGIGILSGSVTFLVTEMFLYPSSTRQRFTPTSRTNTQAILDITGADILTANNVSYTENNFTFNGTNSNVVVSTFPNRPTNSLTCAAWINPSRAPSTGTIRGGAISATSSLYLGIFNSVDGGATHSLHWAVQTSSSRPSSQVGSLPRNAWSYIVGVYDGTRSRAYINGVEVYNVALTGTLTDGTYYIGAYGPTPTDGTHNFDGRIANAAIYNRGLTAAEISQNFNAQRRIYGI
jgi:hypothetical protein